MNGKTAAAPPDGGGTDHEGKDVPMQYVVSLRCIGEYMNDSSRVSMETAPDPKVEGRARVVGLPGGYMPGSGAPPPPSSR